MSYTYLFTDTQIGPIIDKYINMIDDYDFRNLLNSLMGDGGERYIHQRAVNY